MLHLFLFMGFMNFVTASSEKNIFCDYGSWSNAWIGLGKFDVSDIDPSICTHLTYSYARLSNETGKIRIRDSSLDIGEGSCFYARFVNLKTENPHLKTLISIGGKHDAIEKYGSMTEDQNSRMIFIDSVMEFLKTYGFDGLNIDWWYPKTEMEKTNFVLLLQDLKIVFEPRNYLLSGIVAASPDTVGALYDIPGISRYLDFVTLQTYEYQVASAGKTALNAPLYAALGTIDGNDDPFNVNYSVNYWLDKGAPKEKLIVSLPMFASTFQLADPDKHGINDEAVGDGQLGPFVGKPGELTHLEICEKLKTEDWVEVRDDEQVGLYRYRDNQWISYDDDRIIREKAEYVLKLDLAGVNIISVEQEDWRGSCGRKYPLINTLNEILRPTKH